MIIPIPTGLAWHLIWKIPKPNKKNKPSGGIPNKDLSAAWGKPLIYTDPACQEVSIAYTGSKNDTYYV